MDTLQGITEFVKSHVGVVAALGGVAGAVLAFIWQYILHWWMGSRRGSKNWARIMELSGNTSLMKLLSKRVVPDTMTNEGDAASVYGMEVVSYVYEVIEGVRKCFKRTSVVVVFAYYQWETVRKRGQNLMHQLSTEPIPSTGLEERKDAAGNVYWDIVPKADELVEPTDVVV